MTTETAERRGLEGKLGSDPIIDILNRTLPTTGGERKYSNIQPWTEGGTRKIYTAEWGPRGKKVVIKVDKEPKSPRAIRHVERGYNTERELQIASGIEDPELHNVVRLRDFYTSPELQNLDPNFSGTITIEDYFPGRTLKEIVEEKTLEVREFEQVFGDVLEAERYLINDEGLLHRDLSRNNILIKKNGRMSARVTDLTNACDKGETSVKTLPTSGAMSILDPRTCSIFSGGESKYTEQSEIYAIGKNMLYALTGIDPVEYDPDKGTATNTMTGESLLDSRGIVDVLKHERAVEIARSRIPSKASRYDEILRRSMSLCDELRYHSIDDLIKDFNEARKPTFWEKVKKHKFVTGLITAGLLALGATTLVGGYNLVKNKALEEKLVESEKYPVAGKWNGEGLEITNNLADLSIIAYVENNWGKVYPDSSSFLSVKPGQKIWGYIRSKEIARPEEGFSSSPSLKGKVYIEGYKGDEFSIWPKDVNEAIMYEHWSEGMGSRTFSLDVPKDMPEGVYPFAVELYAGDNSQESNFINERNINFKQPGKVIARKRIPIVVGNPDNKSWLRKLSLNTGWSDSYTMARLYDPLGKMNPDLKYEISIPEDDTSWGCEKEGGAYNTSFGWLRLDDKRDTTLKTLQIVVKDEKGKVVGYNFAPIQMNHIANDYYTTGYGEIGPEWSERLIAYRKAIYGDRTEADSIRAAIKNEKLEREREKADSLTANYKVGAIGNSRGYFNGMTGK